MRLTKIQKFAPVMRHPPTFASIVQNTVLAQDVWLEENNIFSDKDAYSVDTLPPCSKPQPSVKNNHTTFGRTFMMLGCQAHISTIHLLARGGYKDGDVDVEISDADLVLNCPSRLVYSLQAQGKRRHKHDESKAI